MRPIHMTIGDRHLVRHDFPGGVRVRFEDKSPASRAAPQALPAGPPAGRRNSDDARSGLRPSAETSFPSMAEIRRRSDEATAEIFRPLHRALVALALGALVAAAAFTTVSLARLDRQVAVEARV